MTTSDDPDAFDAFPNEPDGVDEQIRQGSTAVAAGILASRLTGLLREMATARFLGVGIGAEAFKAALRVPNLLQNLLGEGVLSASFVPVYARLHAAGRRAEADRLASAVLIILLALTTVVVTLTVLFARPITRLLAWGFVEGSQRFELTVTLVRIVTPGVGLLVVAAWCLAVLNAHRRFFLAYVAPAAWNAAIIAALIAAVVAGAGQVDLATAMAIGAVAGSGLQVAVKAPVVFRLVRLRALQRHRPIEGLRDVVVRFGQAVAGRGSVQLSAYIDLVAASLLAAGAVAALGYAQVLYLLPISLFGMSIAASELPALSTMNLDERRAIVHRLQAGLGRVAFFIVPTAVVFIVLGDRVVSAVFAGGRFGDDAAVQVGLVLAAYGLGLAAAASSRLLQSVLYGLGDARVPAIAAAVRVTVATALGVALMLPLDAWLIRDGVIVAADRWTFSVADDTARAATDSLLRLGAVGLAFGASFGAWIEWLILRASVRRRLGGFHAFGRHQRQLVVAGVVAAAAAFAARTVELTTGSSRFDALAMLAMTGVLYLAACHALRIPEAAEFSAWRRG